MPHTVLVVDDDHSVRNLVATLLREAGNAVMEASGGHEAINLIRATLEAGRPLHIMVTDVQMPGMGGRVLADTAVAMHPGLSVIYMSGHVDDEVLSRRVEAGEAVLLWKPAGVLNVARVVDDTLNRP